VTLEDRHEIAAAMLLNRATPLSSSIMVMMVRNCIDMRHPHPLSGIVTY
jgi:hypothetical protein